MVITDFQDFLQSPYYNGESIIKEKGGIYFLTFKIPKISDGIISLKNINFFVGHINEGYYKKPQVFIEYTGRYYQHTFRIYTKNLALQDLRYVCLGQGDKKIQKELQKIYKGMPSSLIKIAMITESVLNIQ